MHAYVHYRPSQSAQLSCAPLADASDKRARLTASFEVCSHARCGIAVGGHTRRGHAYPLWQVVAGLSRGEVAISMRCLEEVRSALYLK